MQFTRTGGCILNERNGSKISMHRRTESTQSSWVKGVKTRQDHDSELWCWVRCREATGRRDCTSEVESADGTMWYQLQEHPIKGQPQRRRRIMQMKWTRQQWKARGPFQHHFRVSRQRESWSHRVAHIPYRAWCESSLRERGRNADHNRLADEQDQVIDDVPVDYAFLW